MSYQLSPETEARIVDAVNSGLFPSAGELVEAAVQRLLEGVPASDGQFHRLRREIEKSGVPLLSDEDLRQEVRERRGSWA